MNLTSSRSVLTTVLTVAILLTSATLSNAQTAPAFTIQIEKDEGQTGFGALQGQVTSVDVSLLDATLPLTEIRLVISYPTNMLSFDGLSIEGSVLTENCGWDQFVVQPVSIQDTSSNCPRSGLRITGFSAHPPGHIGDNNCLAIGKLFSLRFLLSNDRNYECQFAPVKFAFVDCQSNVIWTENGDLAWPQDPVENPWQLSGHQDCAAAVTPDNPSEQFPNDTQYPPACISGPGTFLHPSILLIDGGVDFVCTPEIDEAGDLNLDGLAYTIADRIRFERFFLYGDTVLYLPDFMQEHWYATFLAATDVNKDDVGFTVADLVYLSRVVSGDAVPRYEPDEELSTIYYDIIDHHSAHHVLSTEQEVGGAYVTVEGQANLTIPADNVLWKSFYRPEDGLTHIIIYAEYTGNAFTGDIVRSSNPIHSVELSTPEGGTTVAVRGGTLPSTFVLYQNFPNPFNPATTIQFALPVKSDYTLTIFNANGQQVEIRQGRAEAGIVKVDWDGSDYASGVYFYKVEALGYDQTRKMLLLK